MKKNKHKTKKEFSKKIIIFTGVINVIVIAFACAVIWRTGDTSGLAYLIPSSGGAFASAAAFYYNKAKKENEIKLMNKYKLTKEQMADLDSNIEDASVI